MLVLGIDPGDKESGYVIWDSNKKRIVKQNIIPNKVLLEKVLTPHNISKIDAFAIEMIASYGMVVGKTIFDTCVWIGKFTQRIEDNNESVSLIYRKQITKWHCKNANADDALLRKYLIAKFGDPCDHTSITKDVRSHTWSALAVATFYSEFKEYQASLARI